jgi:hypothetical protein
MNYAHRSFMWTYPFSISVHRSEYSCHLIVYVLSRLIPECYSKKQPHTLRLLKMEMYPKLWIRRQSSAGVSTPPTPVLKPQVGVQLNADCCCATSHVSQDKQPALTRRSNNSASLYKPVSSPLPALKTSIFQTLHYTTFTPPYSSCTSLPLSPPSSRPTCSLPPLYP